MRLVIGAIAIGVLLACAITLAWSALWHTIRLDHSDFGLDLRAYIAGANRLIETGSPYSAELHVGPIENRAENVPIAYLYPPPLAQAFVPVVAVDHKILAGAWSIAQVLALLVAVPFAIKAQVGWPGPFWLSVVALLLVISEPVNFAVYVGNLSGWLALAAAVLLARAQGGALAASLLAVLKMTPALLLLPVVGRRAYWMPAFALAATVTGISFAMAPGAWNDFIVVLPNILGFPGAQNPGNLSPAAVFGAPWLGLAIAMALAACAAVLGAQGEWARAVAAATGSLLFISPTIWDHYLAPTLVVAIILWPRFRWLARVSVIALLVVAVVLWAPGAAQPLRPVMASIIAWAAIAMTLPLRPPRAQSVAIGTEPRVARRGSGIAMKWGA